MRPVIIMLLFLASTALHAAPSFTSNKGSCILGGCGAFGGTITAQYSGTTTAGNTLVAIGQKNSAPSTASPCGGGSNDCMSDPTNGNWTLASGCVVNTGGPGGAELWYFQNAASVLSSTNVTFTANGNTNGSLMISEATGVLTAAVLDSCNGGNGFAGNPISTTFTDGASGDLLFGWISLSNVSAGLGNNFSYTQIDVQSVFLTEYAVNSGSGSTSVQFCNGVAPCGSSSSNGTWIIIGASLKATGGPAGSLTPAQSGVF